VNGEVWFVEKAKNGRFWWFLEAKGRRCERRARISIGARISG